MLIELRLLEYGKYFAQVGNRAFLVVSATKDNLRAEPRT